MKKIAIISAINTNYGTLLQAYAMQTKLQLLGYDSDIIHYTSNPVKQFYRIINIPFLVTKLKALNVKIITKLRYPGIYKNLGVREKVFSTFRQKKLKMTKKVNSKKELETMICKYRGVILGSDQVWNPQNLEMDYYTLNFVPDNMPKITYAPSFGVSQIPKCQINRTRNYLSRIQHISVREQAGCEIVKRMTGRNVPVVCDPTALLTRKQWDMMRSKKKYGDERYIFCYFLGSNRKYRDFADKISDFLGYPIVAIQHMDEFVKSDLHFADRKPYDVDPADFVSLIANAEFVLTDSFHGTMFSVYYHVKFFTFNYDVQGSKGSVNSRIDSIMSLLDMGDRRLTGKEDAKSCLEREIDWNAIQSKLDEFRNESEEYLVNALEKSGLSAGI